MMEGWLRTFTHELSGHPGCQANSAVALADDGTWSVYVEPSPEDARNGIAFVLDRQRRKQHWDDTQSAIARCGRSAQALVDAPLTPGHRALPARLNDFFDSYVLVQAHYQASSDRFTRAASRRYAGDTWQADAFAGWSGAAESPSASLKERRAWRRLRKRAAEDGWSRERVADQVRQHAIEYGSSLAGATGSSDEIVASLLRAWDRDDDRPAPARSRPAEQDTDEMYSALRELGQQRLAIRDGFTVAARASSETLRGIAYAGFGDHVSPQEKLALWKSVTIGELRRAAEGSTIDPHPVARRRHRGALMVRDTLAEPPDDEAGELRELILRDSADQRGKPLRGLVGYRGEAETVEGRAFVLTPGKSPEENVAACAEGLRDGDILVTGMTHPWLVPACTRAAGILTDHGGVTCHAVVVATELGIPCIVGTGYATEVLRSGDHIVLTMSSGSVEKRVAQ